MIKSPTSAALDRSGTAGSHGEQQLVDSDEGGWDRSRKVHHHCTIELPGRFTYRHIGFNVGHYLVRRELRVHAEDQATTCAAFDGSIGSYGYTAYFLRCQQRREALRRLGIGGNNV